MGLLCLSRPTHTLAQAVVTALTGGILFLTFLCDGSTLPSHTQKNVVTPNPHAAPAPITSLPEVVDGALGFSVLQHPAKEKAVAGEDVVFSCRLSGGAALGVEVQWLLLGSEERHNVLQGNQTSGDAFSGRAFLSGDPLAGDFSMTLRNVSVEDRGVYLCLLTPPHTPTVEGSGTRLSIRKEWGLYWMEESVGVIVGVTVAAVAVVVCLIVLVVTQFKDKLNCLQK